MMLGLPNDTIKKSLYTCLEFIKLKPDCVRIYPTLVIRDTFMEKQYYNGEYMPLELDEAIDQSTIILMLFYLNDINVIRVGLQPTENMQLGKDVVTGPFHPAFRQLVESNIYKVLLDQYFSDKGIINNKSELVIEANKKKISLLAGQKSSNSKYWIEKYGFTKVRIYERDIDLDYINISNGKLCDKIDLKELMKNYILNNQLIKTIEGFRI